MSVAWLWVWPSYVKGNQASSPTCLPKVLLIEECFESLRSVLSRGEVFVTLWFSVSRRGELVPKVRTGLLGSSFSFQGRTVCGFLGEQVRPGNLSQQSSSGELSSKGLKDIHCINELIVPSAAKMVLGMCYAWEKGKKYSYCFLVFLVQKRNPS